MLKWLYYSLQTKNFPLFWSYIWKYNIQVNKRLTKVKEKLSTIKLWCTVFVLSFFFSIAMSQTISVINKWCVLCFTCIKLVVPVLACACVITCIKWRRLVSPPSFWIFLMFPNFLRSLVLHHSATCEATHTECSLY